MSATVGNDTKPSSPSANDFDNAKCKFEPKQNKKIFRLLTVVAYVISVSLAAFILSLYYVFIWDPQTAYKEKEEMLKQKMLKEKDSCAKEHSLNGLHFDPASSVPGSGVVGGIDQAEARVATGLPSSAQEDYENNASRPEHHVATAAAAAATTGIQSKANVSNSGSSEDDSNSSSSFGGAMGKRKKPSEEVSSPHQRPQVLQT